MKDLRTEVQIIYQKAFDTIYPGVEQSVQVDDTSVEFGHFTSNIAMKSAKVLREKPLDIAKPIVENLGRDPRIASVEFAQPGFINITLTDEFLHSQATAMLKNVASYIGTPLEGVSMVIDYSHPNIGKPMGVHHLLSTIIGDSIKKTYISLGAKVIADNFIGDMGTQFGKLIHAVKSWGDMQAIEKNPVPELLKLYVQFHIAADSDDTLDDAGRIEYKKLEEGDPENRALLEKIQAWSKAEMQLVYDQLEVQFDYMNGESFYEDKMQPIIDLGIEKGIFVESQGALICKSDDTNEPPALIRKKDGTSLYLTRDLARVAYWQERWHPQLMVNVVDVAQSFQMKQVYDVSAKLGLTDAKNIHVAFGRMNFKDGSMSTRKGNILLVEDVILQTKEHVKEKIVNHSRHLMPEEQDQLATLLTINVLKYNILRQNRLTNITFDIDAMLTLNGNSAPYIAYSAVRMSSIDSKSVIDGRWKHDKTTMFNQEEVQLILLCTKIRQILLEAAKNYQPVEIATYCYEICKLYNTYYQKYPILSENHEYDHRLMINNLCLMALKYCCDVMGMKLPDKM